MATDGRTAPAPAPLQLQFANYTGAMQTDGPSPLNYLAAGPYAVSAASSPMSVCTPQNVATTTWRTQTCPHAPARRQAQQYGLSRSSSNSSNLSMGSVKMGRQLTPSATPSGMVAPANLWPSNVSTPVNFGHQPSPRVAGFSLPANSFDKEKDPFGLLLPSAPSTPGTTPGTTPRASPRGAAWGGGGGATPRSGRRHQGQTAPRSFVPSLATVPASPEIVRNPIELAAQLPSAFGSGPVNPQQGFFPSASSGSGLSAPLNFQDFMMGLASNPATPSPDAKKMKMELESTGSTPEKLEDPRNTPFFSIQ